MTKSRTSHRSRSETSSPVECDDALDLLEAIEPSDADREALARARETVLTPAQLLATINQLSKGIGGPADPRSPRPHSIGEPFTLDR